MSANVRAIRTPDGDPEKDEAPDIDEGSKVAKVGISLPPDLFQAIEAEARKLGMKRSQWVQEACAAHIRRYESGDTQEDTRSIIARMESLEKAIAELKEASKGRTDEKLATWLAETERDLKMFDIKTQPYFNKLLEDSVNFWGDFTLVKCGELAKQRALTDEDIWSEARVKTVLQKFHASKDSLLPPSEEDVMTQISSFAQNVGLVPHEVLKAYHKITGEETEEETGEEAEESEEASEEQEEAEGEAEEEEEVTDQENAEAVKEGKEKPRKKKAKQVGFWDREV